MKERAGEVIECLAEESTSSAAKELYRKDMEKVQRYCIIALSVFFCKNHLNFFMNLKLQRANTWRLQSLL
jgi:hypothetical protein